MSIVEDRIREEVQSRIPEFVNGSVEKFVSFLCSSLPDKNVTLNLLADISSIKIEYTEIGWFSKERKTLVLSQRYPISKRINTGNGTTFPGIEKVGSAEMSVEFKSSGELANIDFTQTSAGIGASIHSVKFNFKISGAVNYN